MPLSALTTTAGRLARMVKIEHSIFALPFAYAGAFLAAGGWPGWRIFLWVSVAMVGIRSLAMCANRLLDLDIDRQNPRTQNRPLVTGEISVRAGVACCLVSGAVFLIACAALNAVVLALSPIAILVAAGYSLTKRVTWLCHFVLGSVLALAPVGSWLAVTETISPGPVILGLAVLFWVAGFDILYALQDVDFDRVHGIHSIPVRFGIPTALALSGFCHVNTAVLFLLAGWVLGLGWPYFLVLALVSGALIWQHTLISEDDLSRVNLAFFTVNGFIALAIFGGVLLELLLR